ncbi:amidase family protein [Kibdelosporangium phytohabitans]|uniref:Amidase domain-containing protein n=1 Tax=Kibdelosporangium phytohabitans TaxID=860235 RepID=A0A0N9HTG1_9PSEU|nr:amidase family protein [Kibdelosporangium phytohabitans]ALG08412.1 hypothetical protein AOZ06_17165 [Kibdelosporangium phytohabitans]MBE1470539.1 amidase [Kibdelosporangium phytohabitans]
MARPWPRDLYGWSATTSFTAAVERGPTRPLKVAVRTETGLDAVEPHPQAAFAVRRTASLLRELGHDVREIPIPVACDEQTLTNWFAYTVGVGVSALMPPEGLDRLQPFTRHLVDTAAATSARDVVLTQAALARYTSAFLAALDEFDVALTPTTSGPPVPVGHYATRGAEGVFGLMLDWSCYTPWVNFSGQPAVSLPSYLDSDGLPYGVQLVGRPRHDAELLTPAKQWRTLLCGTRSTLPAGAGEL